MAYEHQTLRLVPFGQLTEVSQRAFLDLLPSLPASALTQTHDGLRTGSHCGIVMVGEWSLEILPKIYAESEKEGNRGLLVQMLGTCFDLPVWQNGLASTGNADNLLHIIIQVFLDELQTQVTQGLIRSYITVEDCLARPRGRLNLARQLRLGRAQMHQIHCEFDELTADNVHNQAVKAALAVARQCLRKSSSLVSQADRLAFTVEEVSSKTVTATDIAALPVSRLTQRYGRLLLLSSWLLQLSGPDVHVGDERGLSLLFDMNRLFQDYLAVHMHEAVGRHPLRDRLQLSEERPVRNLVQDMNGTGRFSLRPDLVIKLDGKVVGIVDAKWKRLDSASDVNKAGVSQSDLYQLLAYGHTYQCDQLTLAYPSYLALKNWTPPGFRFSPHTPSAIALVIYVFSLDAASTSADALLELHLQALG